MNDYKVGYRKPPKETRFRPGVCPNPKGRGKRRQLSTAESIRKFLGEEVSFRENGIAKKSTRAEYEVRRLIGSALQGDVRSAAQLLKLRRHARSTDIDTGPLVIRILGGLPEE